MVNSLMIFCLNAHTDNANDVKLHRTRATHYHFNPITVELHVWLARKRLHALLKCVIWKRNGSICTHPLHERVHAVKQLEILLQSTKRKQNAIGSECWLSSVCNDDDLSPWANLYFSFGPITTKRPAIQWQRSPGGL